MAKLACRCLQLRLLVDHYPLYGKYVFACSLHPVQSCSCSFDPVPFCMRRLVLLSWKLLCLHCACWSVRRGMPVCALDSPSIWMYVKVRSVIFFEDLDYGVSRSGERFSPCQAWLGSCKGCKRVHDMTCAVSLPAGRANRFLTCASVRQVDPWLFSESLLHQCFCLLHLFAKLSTTSGHAECQLRNAYAVRTAQFACQAADSRLFQNGLQLVCQDAPDASTPFDPWQY